MAYLRFVLVPHLGFTLLLQAVLFELLRVHRLVGALHVRLLAALLLRAALAAFALRPLATVRAIATVSATASAAPAAIAAPATMLFAFLLRRATGILRSLLRALLLRRPLWPLLRLPFALRTIDLRAILAAVRAFGLRKLALLLHLPLRPVAARAVRAWLLLLRRASVAALLLVAALLVVASAAAVALVLAATVTSVTSASAIAAASSATPIPSATLAAALLVPVAVFIARAFRPGRTDGRFIGGRRLLGRLLRLEPAEQAAEES
jgi:hypothetical protein